MAFAMTVSEGFTALDDTKHAASTTYRLSRSWALQLRRARSSPGRVPMRQVPFWWPTPSSGMRFLKYACSGCVRRRGPRALSTSTQRSFSRLNDFNVVGRIREPNLRAGAQSDAVASSFVTPVSPDADERRRPAAGAGTRSSSGVRFGGSRGSPGRADLRSSATTARRAASSSSSTKPGVSGGASPFIIS